MSDVRDNSPPDDTSAEARAVQVAIYRRLSPEQKLRIAFDLNRLARDVARAGLRERHPQADEREIFMRLLVLELGPELVRQAYGWQADD